MPDPGLYVDPSYHQIEKRYIRKFAEKEDIDAICEEKFDIYMNFMVGEGSRLEETYANYLQLVGSTNR
jgi:hypothetical protein